MSKELMQEIQEFKYVSGKIYKIYLFQPEVRNNRPLSKEKEKIIRLIRIIKKFSKSNT